MSVKVDIETVGAFGKQPFGFRAMSRNERQVPYAAVAGVGCGTGKNVEVRLKLRKRIVEARIEDTEGKRSIAGKQDVNVCAHRKIQCPLTEGFYGTALNESDDAHTTNHCTKAMARVTN